MLTLNDISKKTGLSLSFIRLVKTKLGDILTPYIYRGEKNKLLFDESVILIFDKVKTLKDEGLTTAAIVHGFKHEFNSALQNTNKNKTKLNHLADLSIDDTSDSSTNTLLKNMINGRIQSLEADKTKLELERNEVMQKFKDQDKRIKELEKINLEMKASLKSLPFGRTPGEIRNDYDMHNQVKKEKMRLLVELKNTGTFSFLKKRKIINELIEYV